MDPMAANYFTQYSNRQVLSAQTRRRDPLCGEPILLADAVPSLNGQEVSLPLREGGEGRAGWVFPKSAQTRRRRRAGQSILVAVSVLFIMSFLGALFIAIIARSLQNARQASRTSSADAFAQAGIDFADRMLQTSPEGADWRPPMQYRMTKYEVGSPACPYNTGAQCDSYSVAVNSGLLATPNISDPDYQWLNIGFTRYNVGEGRFLLRLSYVDEPGQRSLQQAGQPSSPSQTSKFIKIESIGLEGTIDPDDPTTFVSVASNRRRSERVGYKPITLGDYTLFITNKDNRSEAASLGVPTVAQTVSGNTTFTTPGVYAFFGATPTPAPSFIPIAFGTKDAYSVTDPNAPTVHRVEPGGGSIKCNTDLRLYGLVHAYLNPALGEDIETSGAVLFDGYNNSNALGVQPTSLGITNPASAAAAISDPTKLTISLYPSNAVDASFTPAKSLFTTAQGAVRDGSDASDTDGYPRSIKRRNPPVIDSADPQSHLTRYAALSQIGTSQLKYDPATVTYQDSGGVTQPDTASGPYNVTGSLSTVYVDNGMDTQRESEQITLRDQWLNKADPQKTGYWRGSVYTPPGATVVFGQVPGAVDSTGKGMWGVTITRSNTATNGTAQWNWFNPDGTSTWRMGTRMRFVYGPAPAAQDPADPIFSLSADNGGPSPSGTSLPPNPNNDILICAEGNVRVRGVISDPNGSTDHHVTLVTNGIAYVEGSLLKGRYTKSDGTAVPLTSQDPTDPGQISRSSIAVLARSYVCVNTTQFLPGYEEYQVNLPGANAPPSLGEEGYEFSVGQSLNMAVLYPKLYAAVPQRLYMSTSGVNGDGYGIVTLANDAGQKPITVWQNVPSPANETLNSVIDISASLTGPGPTPPSINYANALNPPFLLNFQIDPAQSAASWILHRAAVLPADVRIEAMLYAQDNSFFVIPGDWFNSNQADTMDAMASRDVSAIDPRYPFYGQPVDLKLTIFGSVSENMTANIADQHAWMLKWGWIPLYHGNGQVDPPSNSALWADMVPVEHRTPDLATDPSGNTPLPVGAGLTFVYDPLGGLPVTGITKGGIANYGYLRLDRYGRPLPFAPNLPVSPDMVYSGVEPASGVSGI